jgi:hypothetical protein
VPVGTTYSWSAPVVTGGMTGGATGTNATSISGTLTNPTNTAQTATYTVTPTSGTCAGATFTLTVTVNPLPSALITAGGPTTFCEGSSVLLIANTGTGLIYQWRLNNFPISGQNNSTLAVNSSGNYSVSILNNYNCSSNSNTVQVTVNTNPSTPLISVNSPTTFCQGDSVVLNVTNDPLLSYQWQNNGINIFNETSNQFTVYNSGNYTILATNSNNCSTGSSIETVTVNQLPPSGISALSTTIFCEGDSVVLQGDYISNGIYNWSNQNGTIANSDSSSLTVFNSGSYSYEIIDSNYCSNQSGIIDVIVNTHNPSEIFTTSLGPYSLNGTTYIESGTYTQNLQTVNGCDSILTLYLEIENTTLQEFVSEFEQLFYPNPTFDNFIYYTKPLNSEIEIIRIQDLNGREVEFTISDNKIEWEDLKNGLYFITFKINNRYLNSKIIFK